jgi:hypothetical protein
MLRAAYVLSFALWFSPAWLTGQSLELVREGKSSYSICMSPQSSPSEKYAAGELQRFLEQISGARLPIQTECAAGKLILVGQSAHVESLRPAILFTSLGEEGFVLRTAGDDLVIAGGSRRGTLYGVYTLLEKLGCRWFTRDVQRVPKSATIRVGPMDETHRPAFEYREPFFTEAFDRDWAARNKVNGASMRLDEATGGKITYYPFVHTFYAMIPPEKYFSDHPEYFSLIDGKRRHERGQLCLTNPDLLRESVRVVLGWIREHPEARIYSVSQNDWTGWCECDACRRVELEEGGVHSGPLLRFVNAIAAEVGKQHPDKLIDTLAYWYTEDPPTRVRPLPNVRIRLCPIGACEAHPYEACPRNAYFMKVLRAWSAITNQLYIWHYNTNFSHYLAPFPDFDELAADIPMYKRHGVVGLFMEGAYPEGGGGENAELRSYLMARLLWNPKEDVKRVIDEFLEGVYGRAAPAMREYFEWTHRQVRTPPNGLGHHLHIFMQTSAPHLSREYLQRSQGILERAARLSDSEEIRRRVQRARLSIDYVELMQARRFVVRDERYEPLNSASLLQRYREFVGAVRSFGTARLRESTKLEDDESAFERSLKSLEVTTLEDERWRVDALAELNGRVVRLTDKTAKRDLLVTPDSGQFSYPNVGGWQVSAFPDYHSRQAIPITWKVASYSGRDAELAGTGPNGLLLRRTISLANDGLVRTSTVAMNGGSEEVGLALQARFELDPGSSGNPIIKFDRQDGGQWVRELSDLERDPSGPETHTDGARPAGEWCLVLGGSKAASLVRFPKEQVERAYTSWGLRTARSVTFGLWSPVKTLKPGDILRLDCAVLTQSR